MSTVEHVGADENWSPLEDVPPELEVQSGPERWVIAVHGYSTYECTLAELVQYLQVIGVRTAIRERGAHLTLGAPIPEPTFKQE